MSSHRADDGDSAASRETDTSTSDGSDTATEQSRDTGSRLEGDRHDGDRYAEPEPAVVPPARRDVVALEKERFGGVKPFVAFFGWLTATGMLVLLTALLAGVGFGTGRVSSGSDVSGLSVSEATWVGAVALVVLVFVSYYAGGYVAGRMARFDGMRQGVAVWVWAVIISILLGVLGAVAGSRDAVDVSSLPTIPTDLGSLSPQALTALVGVVLGSLVGAVLGGLAGMRFHRRVDKVGLGA